MARCGFAAKGLFVMDGSRARRTPTPTSPASARPSASSSSTPCSPRWRPARSRRCSRTSSATSSTATSIKRIVAMFGAQPRRSSRCSAGSSTQTWFYTGLGVRPTLARAERRARAAAVPARRAGVRLLRVAAVRAAARAATSSRPTPTPARHAERPRPRRGAAQAARGQRLDADARPAVRALLLFASAGRRAPGGARRPTRRADRTMTNFLHQQLPGRAPAAMSDDDDPRPPGADQRLARCRRRDREDLRLQGLPRDDRLRRTRWPGSATPRTTTPTCASRYDRCVVRFNDPLGRRHLGQRLHLRRQGRCPRRLRSADVRRRSTSGWSSPATAATTSSRRPTASASSATRAARRAMPSSATACAGSRSATKA